MMNLLMFYVNEKQHHEGELMYEWLLHRARHIGVRGGSAFRAMAGFGRHGRLHDEAFFELAGDLTVRVEFILDDGLAKRMLEEVRGLDVFYVVNKVQSGID
ncbi:MAG: DUF190 domain-containing protein [Gallionella sp.]|nr:DUF190 domain-containing protein [Gallionella sp.]